MVRKTNWNKLKKEIQKNTEWFYKKYSKTMCPCCKGKGYVLSNSIPVKWCAVWRLVLQGWSYRKIMKTLGISFPSMVQYYLKKALNSKDKLPKPKMRKKFTEG